jgi:hypothetical protein
VERLSFIKTLTLLFPLLIFLSIFSITLTRFAYLESEISFKTQNTGNLEGQVISETSCTPITCPSGQTWDDATCSCVECVPYECGGAMYFNPEECVCMCPSYPTCTEDEYFDTWDCTCKPKDGSCTEPANGCPTGSLWDSASCACETSSTCQEPAGGCGENHYWDEAICSCKCASYVACPTDYYWDTVTCSCVSSGTNTTTETTSTTSSGGDSTTDTTDATTSDTITVTSCSPPASGCPLSYFWDYDYCKCVYDPSLTTSTCSKPPEGCSFGYYWDNITCSCIYSKTSLDRLAYEPPDIISCVKSKLTDYEYQKFRYFLPTNQLGFDEIHKLHDKTASCWTAETGTIVTAQPKTPLLEKEQCLIKSIGENAYRQIYEGRRNPTHNEHLWFEKCYGKVQKDAVALLTVNEKLSPETISCLKRSLRDDLYQKIYSGQAEVPPNRQKSVDVCFGVRLQPFEQGSSYKIPESVKSCLNEAVGEARLSQIITGSQQASKEEKEKTKSCFAKLNLQQIRFLPPPPEQVPFYEESEEIILEKAEQEIKTAKQKAFGGKLTLSGKAQPNTIVTIYIYSDPIVVTTKTDENGDWVFEMQKPLNEGRHVAYALTKSDKSGYVRSAVISFEVLAAEDEPTPQVFMEEDKASEIRKKFIYYSAGLVLSITLIVTGGIYYLHAKRRIKEIDNLISDGNSKTKSGSGPVN